MMWPLFFGIISAVSFGISNVYWKKASQQVDFPYLVLFRGLFASLALGALWLICGRYNPGYWGAINTGAGTREYLYAVVICLVCSLGLIFFLSSIRYTLVSITLAISNINIFGILTTVFILGETFLPVYLVTFILAFVGIMLCRKSDPANVVSRWNRGATYALLATFFWGITYPLFKILSPGIGAVPLSFILEASVTFAAFIWIRVEGRTGYDFSRLVSKSNLRHYGTLATLLIGGTLFSNLAIQRLGVFHLGIIGNLQFIVSVLMGMLMYRENLSVRQWGGILLIFLSILVFQLLGRP